MYIAIFKNARAVVIAERKLQASGIKVRVIPVPTKISSECGLCLEVEADEIEQIKEVLPQTTIYEL